MRRFRAFLAQGRPHTWTDWVHLVASLTALGGFVVAPLALADETWEAVLVAWLCLAFTVTLVLLYVQELRYRRLSTYAAAMESFHEAYSLLRDASFIQFVSRNGEEEFRTKLQDAIKAFGAGFSTVTGSSCRVCIKQISGAERKPVGLAATRDIKVQDLCRSSADSPPTSVDYVSDNTDFEELFEEAEDVFFANDLRELSRRGQYKNSHWGPDTIEKKSYTYLATIVWPIVKPLQDPESAPKVEALRPTMDILGFLCIDSLTPNVFNRASDVPLGAAFADTLYAVLKTRAAARRQVELPERSEVDGR